MGLAYAACQGAREPRRMWRRRLGETEVIRKQESRWHHPLDACQDGRWPGGQKYPLSHSRGQMGAEKVDLGKSKGTSGIPASSAFDCAPRRPHRTRFNPRTWLWQSGSFSMLQSPHSHSVSLENVGGPGGGAGRGAHLRDARDLDTQEPGGRPHLKPWRAVVPVALPLSDTYSPHAVRR